VTLRPPPCAASLWWTAWVALSACRPEEPPQRRAPLHPISQVDEAVGMAAAETSTLSDLVELLARREARRAAELAAAPTPVTLGKAPTAVDLAAATTQSAEALVWRSDGDRTQTWWLQREAVGMRVVASRAGLWLAGRDDLYQWKATARAVRVCDPAVCATQDGLCTPKAGAVDAALGRIATVELRGLRSGRKIAVSPAVAPTLALDLGTAGVQREVTPLGQLDRDLFVRMTLQTSDCGPLPGSVVHDDRVLRGLAPPLQPVLVSGEDDPLLADDVEVARQQLQGGPDAMAGQLRFRSAHVRLATTAPLAHGKGSPPSPWQLYYEFAVVDPAGRTLRQTQLPASHAPLSWQEALQAAPDVRALLPHLQLDRRTQGAGKSQGASQLPDEPHAGWSWLTLPAAERVQLRQRFSASADP
jgi:hypothetical protein